MIRGQKEWKSKKNWVCGGVLAAATKWKLKKTKIGCIDSSKHVERNETNRGKVVLAFLLSSYRKKVSQNEIQNWVGSHAITLKTRLNYDYKLHGFLCHCLLLGLFACVWARALRLSSIRKRVYSRLKSTFVSRFLCLIHPAEPIKVSLYGKFRDAFAIEISISTWVIEIKWNGQKSRLFMIDIFFDYSIANIFVPLGKMQPKWRKWRIQLTVK